MSKRPTGAVTNGVIRARLGPGPRSPSFQASEAPRGLSVEQLLGFHLLEDVTSLSVRGTLVASEVCCLDSDPGSAWHPCILASFLTNLIPISHVLNREKGFHLAQLSSGLNSYAV